MPLFTSSNEVDTERTAIFIVDLTRDFSDFPLLKSTDANLPEGLTFLEEDGTLKDGCKVQESIFTGETEYYASVQVFVNTLEDVIASKVKQFEDSARSEITKIDVLTANPEEQKQVILDKLEVKRAEVQGKITIQDAEKVVW